MRRPGAWGRTCSSRSAPTRRTDPCLRQVRCHCAVCTSQPMRATGRDLPLRQAMAPLAQRACPEAGSLSATRARQPGGSRADVRSDRLFAGCRPRVEFEDLPADPGLVDQLNEGGGDVVAGDPSVELCRPEGHGADPRTVEKE